uniref:Uncharacterized protein n=1 Tax=Rhizophagus irregularis (strain DAOM 181602 / DAOM 197198 / MUCL 43194) TaxID=747089 RepID=U9TMX4_RHIID
MYRIILRVYGEIYDFVIKSVEKTSLNLLNLLKKIIKPINPIEKIIKLLEKHH